MANVTARIAELIERGDIDDLLREIDGLCDEQQWGALYQLRDQCKRAVQRGKQLWPVAAHAEYRLALEAPAQWAAQMLVPGSGRFALGPLSEVVAVHHPWADLAADAPPGPTGALAAHECVIRGEDVRGDGRIDPDVLELPLVLQDWEPAYPLAEYTSHDAQFPAPPSPPFERTTLPDRGGLPVDDGEVRRALLDLATGWTTESNGRATAMAVSGTALHAVAALGFTRARVARVETADALAHMAWAGASGGAHGRRRGMAAGRFAAWWATAAVAGLLDTWPVPPEELGQAAASLRWYLWDTNEPHTGWILRVAVEAPDEGVAWALSADDSSLV